MDGEKKFNEQILPLLKTKETGLTTEESKKRISNSLNNNKLSNNSNNLPASKLLI